MKLDPEYVNHSHLLHRLQHLGSRHVSLWLACQHDDQGVERGKPYLQT